MSESIEKIRKRPRRTMLYVSADIDKHMNKSLGLPTDAIIFDLYESISPEFKQRGRDKVRKFLAEAESHGQEPLFL